MPDLPISALPTVTELTADDLFAVVNDPSGIATTAKIIRANASKSIVDATAKIVNYSYTANDEVIKFDTTSGNVTASLPSAVGNKGKWFTAIKTVAANSLIIDPSGTELINGAATLTLTAQNSSVTFYSDGSNWFINSNTASGGSGDVVGPAYETVSKNLKSYSSTFSYNGSGDLSTITYTVPGGNIIKTFNYASGDLTSIVLSGNTPAGINLTKTLSYSAGNLTGVSYS